MNREIKFRAFSEGRIWDWEEIRREFDTWCFSSDPKNQFTGEKDFENKDIYVGDILSDRWKVEVYQNKEGTFMIKFHTNPKRNKPMTLNKYLKAREIAGTSICEGYRDCIVIGNIYENPELLSGQ
jgi:hypothetical protein